MSKHPRSASPHLQQQPHLHPLPPQSPPLDLLAEIQSHALIPLIFVDDPRSPSPSPHQLRFQISYVFAIAALILRLQLNLVEEILLTIAFPPTSSFHLRRQSLLHLRLRWRILAASAAALPDQEKTRVLIVEQIRADLAFKLSGFWVFIKHNPTH